MEELNLRKKDYEKALEEGSIQRLNDILDQLYSFPVTLSILKSTGMVAVLKKTKHSKNEDVKGDALLQKKCADLLAKWKEDVTRLLKKESSEPSTPTTPSETETKSPKAENSPSPSPREVKPPVEDLTPSQIDAILNSGSLNPTRKKFRNLLYDDFKEGIADLGFSKSSLAKMIGDLESALNEAYNRDGSISDEYRKRFRDIRFNLGNNKNLLSAAICGDLSPSRLARMSAAEMISDEVKKERDIIKEEMFEASQTNWVSTHMMDHFSGGFRCRRCGSDKTQYQQKQTRSADEPMTVFFECMACGKRWRE